MSKFRDLAWFYSNLLPESLGKTDWRPGAPKASRSGTLGAFCEIFGTTNIHFETLCEELSYRDCVLFTQDRLGVSLSQCSLL